VAHSRQILAKAD